jgi:hypothetical protein
MHLALAGSEEGRWRRGLAHRQRARTRRQPPLQAALSYDKIYQHAFWQQHLDDTVAAYDTALQHLPGAPERKHEILHEPGQHPPDLPALSEMRQHPRARDAKTRNASQRPTAPRPRSRDRCLSALLRFDAAPENG